MDLTTGNITDIKIEDRCAQATRLRNERNHRQALPDVRDGLEPVQRQHSFAMRELGMTTTTS